MSIVLDRPLEIRSNSTPDDNAIVIRAVYK